MPETQTKPEGTAPERKPLPPEVAAACEIAATDAEPDGPMSVIRAAWRDREGEWHRMVWRHGMWQYFATRRLGGRSDIVREDVRPGELLAEHPRGRPIDLVYLVVQAEKPLRRCTFSRTAAGALKITLPDGRQIERPDPRRR